jgi:hypothetical protein
MADVAPFDADEHFDIPDLTEEEWQTFVAALEECWRVRRRRARRRR